ncbi:MAG: hypothetical protein ACJ73N_02125 [Bryobacteraceae bacterium]
MSTPDSPRSVIGLRTALILYALLIIFAALTLKGTALLLTLLIVGALVVKSILHYLRERLE